MHFQSLIPMIPLFLASLTTAAPATSVEEKRIPLIGGFTLSTSPTCPNTGSSPEIVSTRVNIAYGSACGSCVSTVFNTGSGPRGYTIITDTYVDPKCTVTLYQTEDCRDDGAVSGPNCWTPDGGIKGYKVSCPWWPNPAPEGWLKPCSSSP